MKKIPTLFLREQQGKRYLATREVDPDCQWVIDGEGVATEKFDGTCCAVIGGVYYARHRVKKGKPMPDGWRHWSGNPEQMSGHGWVPVGDGPEHRWHREGWSCAPDHAWSDGTYELVGPRVQKNPYGRDCHGLLRHGQQAHKSGFDTDVVPRIYDELKAFLESHAIEGIVWHHPDGRMAKLKRRDFGIPWPVKK